MNKLLSAALAACMLMVGQVAHAGNPEKRGQAGASELLINPWARMAGWGGAYTGGITGVEAMYFNVAGLVKINKTDFSVGHVRYLTGTDININTIGLGQRVGENGVLGVSLMAMDLGDFQRTTTNDPDGDVGTTFSPQFFNISLAYSQVFSNSITGGVLVKLVTQSIDNVNAVGVVFDAGVQYTTGVRDQFKFGVALRSVGPKMRYQGDGLTFRSQNQQFNFDFAANQRSEAFEMPAQLNIGASYDFDLGPRERLTLAGNFTSNTFTKDRIQLGAEFAFMERFMVRGGYAYQEDIFDEELATNSELGPSGGLTVALPFGKADEDGVQNQSLSIDYAYTATRTFDGSHSIALRLAF